MNKQIGSRSFGKWILSGEHTVLRGGSAILFPFNQFYFEILYKEEKLSSDQLIQTGDLRYAKVIKKALHLIGRNKIKGIFHLNSTIPVASGLGSSAAFCICLSKVFYQLGWITENEILKLSIQLENEFHGKSSGADISVVYYNKPILFKNFTNIKFLSPKWNPYFCFVDTKMQSSTKKCVQKVNQFIKNNPDQGEKIDQIMQESVQLSMKSLELDSKEGLSLLKKAMDQAAWCFREWGLCEGKILKKMEELKNQGALAVKPTGAGGGGFIVSLWDKPVKKSL